jgi:GTP-binding protein HflX
MNSISGANVFVEDKLFATLDTTIRSVELNTAHKILLSDTVGFVRKLPHHLVATFKSTLKEVVDADLILLVLDASSTQVVEHYNTILEVLKELGAEKHQMVVIMNKIDEKKAAKQLNFLKRKFPEGIYLSALNNLRINKLTQKIVDLMDKNFQTIDLLFSYKEAKEMSLAQKGVDVLERNYVEAPGTSKLPLSQ